MRTWIRRMAMTAAACCLTMGFLTWLCDWLDGRVPLIVFGIEG
jgi:hypothetical protein